MLPRFSRSEAERAARKMGKRLLYWAVMDHVQFILTWDGCYSRSSGSTAFTRVDEWPLEPGSTSSVWRPASKQAFDDQCRYLLRHWTHLRVQE